MNGETELGGRFVSFDCELVPIPPGTPAAPRPADRPRDPADAVYTPPAFFSFDCELVVLPEGTPAAPRPAHRSRESPEGAPAEADAAFARELANRVLEYVQSRPTGLSAAQLAALVQQLLARRSVGVGWSTSSPGLRKAHGTAGITLKLFRSHTTVGGVVPATPK